MAELQEAHVVSVFQPGCTDPHGLLSIGSGHALESGMAAEAAWEAVIGLETHVQLGTNSKIFTSASTAFGDDPNTHIDPVVCGLPGTLPVLNQKVLEYAVKAAMALNLNIAEHSKFDRKQYFYPDLPKNYQISQYDEPIAEDGWIDVEVAEKGKDTYLKRIGIERLHMEEDAGKLVHAGSDRLAGSTHSLVDYNRAGVDRKSTRLNSSHSQQSRMPSSA